MQTQETTRHCDHPDFYVEVETLFGMRNKDYICTECGAVFGSVEEMRRAAAKKSCCDSSEPSSRQ